MKVSVINYALWGSAFLLQAVTAVLIVRRKQLRTFPVFFAYTTFHIIQSILSFIALRISYTAYFYEWWTGEMLDALVTFAVIQEIFLVTFRPYDALRRWGSTIYVVGALVLCGIAVFMGIHYPHGYSPRVAVLLTLERSTAFVEVGLLFFLFIFCRLFGMTWRNYVFGIAIGFVLTASIVMTAEAFRTYYGTAADSWVLILKVVAYSVGVLVWTYYFASIKSRVPLDYVPGTEKLIAWNKALGEIGRR